MCDGIRGAWLPWAARPRGRGFALAAALVLFAPWASPAAAQQGLEVVGGTGKRTVTLTPREPPQPGDQAGRSTGNLKLVVRSTAKQSGGIKLRYFLREPGRAITVSRDSSPVALAGDRRPTVRPGGIQQLDLRFAIGPGEVPSDIDGDLAIQLRGAGAVPIVVMEIVGSGNAFADVTFQPSKVNLQGTDAWGPFSGAPDQTATVQLRGDDVSSLLRRGTEAPTPSVLLRQGGHDINVQLRDIREESEGVATATVVAEGDLEPGRYEGQLRLSESGTDAPALPVTVKAQDLFVWPVLIVLVGAALGGLLLLLSGLNRRRTILRAHLRDALKKYRDEWKELTENGKEKSPLWSLEDLLGEETPEGYGDTWFKVKWSAMPELDGVQGVWSNVTWARNDEDLDIEAARVGEVLTRVRRWLQVARKVKTFREIVAREPQSRADRQWRKTCTWDDSRWLLREVRESEPADDEQLRQLLKRIDRQARWHDAFAQVWELYTRVAKDMDERREAYTDTDFRNLADADLEKLDSRCTAESERTMKEQFNFEEQLEAAKNILEDLGKKAERPPEEILPEPPREKILPVLSPEKAYQEVAVEEPSVAVLRTDTQPSVVGGLRGVFWRDLVRSAAIALVTAVAYMLPFYDDTWGNWSDYGTAFTAGFLGKVGIQWALLPVFQTIRVRVKRKPEEEDEGEEKDDEGRKEKGPTGDGGPSAPAGAPAA